MLYRETVNPTTWGLVKELMSLSALEDFSLAGGTALALRKGHRISDDLDLFTRVAFDPELIKSSLSNHFGEDISWQFEKGFSLSALIKSIKVDFLRHDYPVLEYSESESIRMLSNQDIAAMKLNAVAKRGSKKDFFDIYELLQEYGLKEILSFFSDKYKQSDTGYVLRSLTYFEDAELEAPLKMMKPYDWDKVKYHIASVVRDFIKMK